MYAASSPHLEAHEAWGGGSVVWRATTCWARSTHQHTAGMCSRGDGNCKSAMLVAVTVDSVVSTSLQRRCTASTHV